MVFFCIFHPTFSLNAPSFRRIKGTIELTAILSQIETTEEVFMQGLIVGCMKNERQAQERLYKHFYPKMMSMVKRYTNYHQYHLAEEILNNGFLKVFEKIDSFSHKGSFEGWVRRIIYHSIFDFVRSTTKYREKVVFEEKEQAISDLAIEKMQYDDIMGLIQKLPDNTRAVFNMYILEGFTHREISEELGISEGTSKWHVHEGRKILKEQLTNLNK